MGFHHQNILWMEEILGWLKHYEVVPQFVSVQLVYKYTITRVDWGVIAIVHGDYKPTNITGGGHHLV